MNKIIVIGNLGNDPEMRYTPGGQSVTNFSLASNRRYTTASGERREETQWFNCHAWGKLGEVCNQYLSKGGGCYVEGRLNVRTYEGRNGDTMVSTDITVDNVHFLGGNSGKQYEQDEADQYDNQNPEDEVDDLPF